MSEQHPHDTTRWARLRPASMTGAAAAALALTATLGVAPAALAAPAVTAVVAHEDSTGTPKAAGDVTFDCILDPFRSGFRYQGPVSVSAAPDPSGATALTATFPDLPGIAPVQIDGGTMHTRVEVRVGGTPVELTSTSTVNAAAKQEVAMPELTGTAEVPVTDAAVELTSFTFEFEKMMGIVISAVCEVTEGAQMGVMASRAAGGDGATAAGHGGEETAAAIGGEAGETLPFLALWAVPVGVALLGLVVWLPKRLRRKA